MRQFVRGWGASSGHPRQWWRFDRVGPFGVPSAECWFAVGLSFMVASWIAVLLVSLAVALASSLVLARILDRVGSRLGCTDAITGVLTALGADSPEIATAVVAGLVHAGVLTMSADHRALATTARVGAETAPTTQRSERRASSPVAWTSTPPRRASSACITP